jgi:hypothetical protein
VYVMGLLLETNFGEIVLGELRRTPCMRTSQNAQNANFAKNNVFRRAVVSPIYYYAMCYRLTVILPFMWGCISQW